MSSFDFKRFWKEKIAAAVTTLSSRGGSGDAGAVDPDAVVLEIPPDPAFGDLGFPMFAFAKTLKKAPARIAGEVAAAICGTAHGDARAEGPYVNVHLDRAAFAADILAAIFDTTRPFGRPETLRGSRIMVEFSSPNTNKPLHLGHLRNDVLGESVSRILRACGAEVRKVCIINDRGVHICKSMLAYRAFGEGKTPEEVGVKSDHFVGAWYVRFNALAKENPGAEADALSMLRLWEQGDADVTALWEKMNRWAVDGMKETYLRTGISFDRYYFESETYLRGKAEILKGLDAGLFYRESDGAVWADLRSEGLDKKVLLRNDGTSLYITQDIGTAILRHQDWRFDRLVFVVGSEQQYYFKALFAILEKLGFPWAKSLFHLSYGMVYLPDGRMKSREGTVVDADDLLDRLRDMAKREIREKEREEAVRDLEETSEKIGLGALHYYLLHASPARDMLFNPQESLSFNGNTGPYLQYMGARLSSLLRRQKEACPKGAVCPALLRTESEWELVKRLAEYPPVIAEAAARIDPSLVAGYLYELSKSFSRFYHECPMLNAETEDLAATRLHLARAALFVLKDALDLICIPFLETM
ncbi:MAG: arginine--tRNA ligase [Spirochaetaceae bacterium]|jgi:arginyl-tRNA synthetase|nr:arginine--tRNA ligase [Spirochaetaceae bacterium]